MLYEPKQETNKQESVGEVSSKNEAPNLFMKMDISKFLSWFSKK
jgi:hypothetical protein